MSDLLISKLEEEEEVSRLTDIEPLEVSLVNRGANQREFLVLKHRSAPAKKEKSIFDMLSLNDSFDLIRKQHAEIKELLDERRDIMTAWERIEKLAEDYRKGKDITKEQAIARVLDTQKGKKLYQEYKDENI